MGMSNYIPSSVSSRAGVCTSTTRPAAPYEGQLIFETDTDSVAFWDGSYWRYIEARKNLLYNGAMQVHQRVAAATNVTGITTSDYRTVDRWYHDISSLGTWTASVENDAPTGSGFRKSAKVLCTTADASPASNDVFTIYQALEGQDLQTIRKGTSSAEQLTLSFWVKSNVTGTYIAELYDGDNTRQVSRSYTIAASGTWEFKTITFPADTTGALDNDNNASLYVGFFLGAGSARTSGTLNTTWASVVNANRVVGQVNVAAAINNYWQVTGVQLNVGSVAAPFEFKSYERELRECQRYYYLFASGSGKDLGVGAVLGTADTRIILPLPVAMRAEPSSDTTTNSGFFIGYYGASSGAATFASLDAGSTTRTSAHLTFNVTSATSGNSCLVRTNNASARVAVTAEL